MRPEPYCSTELSIIEGEFLRLESKLNQVLTAMYPVGSKAKIITPTGWYLGTVENHVDASKGRITIRKFNGRLHGIEYTRLRPDAL